MLTIKIIFYNKHLPFALLLVQSICAQGHYFPDKKSNVDIKCITYEQGQWHLKPVESLL